MGDTALAAKIYFSTIYSYTYLFGFQMGQANSILVGRLFGNKEFDKADRMTKQLYKITIPANLFMSLIVFLFRIPILSIFTDDKKVFLYSIGVMLIDFVVEFARAFSHISEYELRGTGGVTFTMAATVLSCWCFSIGFGYLFSIVLGWGQSDFGLLSLWTRLFARFQLFGVGILRNGVKHPA